MLLVILACNPPWFSIRLSTIHEVADPLAINTMSLRRAAQRIIPSLHRYSVTVKFLPLLYAKNYFYIYIYKNIKSILGGWDREIFYCNAVTL